MDYNRYFSNFAVVIRTMVTEMIETMADQGVVGSLKMIFFSSLRHMEKQRDYPIKYVVALMCLCCFECLYEI